VTPIHGSPEQSDTSGVWRLDNLFRSRWYALAVLTLVGTVNWADRLVVPILFPGIRADLGLTDTQLGIIGGLAFSIIYAISALAFGHAADRHLRKRIIIFGLVLWSAATAAGGLSTDFWSLFATRFFTGIGEASLAREGARDLPGLSGDRWRAGDRTWRRSLRQLGLAQRVLSVWRGRPVDSPVLAESALDPAHSRNLRRRPSPAQAHHYLRARAVERRNSRRRAVHRLLVAVCHALLHRYR